MAPTARPVVAHGRFANIPRSRCIAVMAISTKRRATTAPQSSSRVKEKPGPQGPGFIGRSRVIRTPDPLVPNEVRYQAALYSDRFFLVRCSTRPWPMEHRCGALYSASDAGSSLFASTRWAKIDRGSRLRCRSVGLPKKFAARIKPTRRRCCGCYANGVGTNALWGVAKW